MIKLHNIIKNINEGYQPIVKLNKSTQVSHPAPPKGGSGVPNVFHKTTSDTRYVSQSPKTNS